MFRVYLCQFCNFPHFFVITVYFEQGRSTTSATLKFTLATSTTAVSWNIKVSQISCDSDMRWDCYTISDSLTPRTGGWVNLNFLAPPYGVAFFKSLKHVKISYWIPKSILRPWNEQIFCHFLTKIFEFLAEFWVKFWCDGKKWSKNCGF